ncbi:TIGR03118 family protein [Acidobacteria bacterium AB60]|nr:TIGR03118 family protein [Acidobacteria bacterium AB60]
MILSGSAALAIPAMAQHYQQTNLTADQSGVATNMDTNLVNPWGLSRSSGSPWWISDNGTGLSTLYDGTGAAKKLVVTVPTADPKASPTGTPTGTVFNPTTNFELVAGTAGTQAFFLFATEDGTISGWNPGVNPSAAIIKVCTKMKSMCTSGESVFKGLAMATITTSTGPATYLYAADFRKARVQVYDTNFNRVHFGDDAFQDEAIPNGYAPFNIQNIGGDLYVTFAQQDAAKHDEVDGPGLGYVDVFSASGQLLHRFQHGDWLNGPWGLALASGDFGIYSHDLLVGQFGSGNIAVYEPQTGRFLGMLQDKTNTPITIDGLWGLSFGSGTTGSGPATTLYFSAGSDGEQHGLFGTITPVENTLGNGR